ncbi:helix-turn-helix transcriptional regulator [Nocardia sp. NPDC004278]
MDLSELGAFLKSRRDRVRPADIGLPTGPRRRVPGLRRDEVATVAGVSTDYYVELEQGRGVQPSEQMLAVLSRTLRLSSDERDHLYHLAGRPLPPVHGIAAHVHPGMLDLLDRLPNTPAQVITDLSAPLVQNPLARALLGPPRGGKGIEASFIYQWFADPSVRALYHPDEHAYHSRVFVADMQAVAARRGKDPEVIALTQKLLGLSAEFAELWGRRDVGVRRADRKRLIHPVIGELELNCLSLLSEDGTQRLLWFTPVPGTRAVEQLELLSVVGEQEIAQ